MQFGDAPVIAIEESGKILDQIALIVLADRAHDAEVDRDEDCGLSRSARSNKKIARMDIRVEEVVAKHLGEEQFDPRGSERMEVDAGSPQCVQIADGDAVDALHDQHIRPGIAPEDLRHMHQR